MDDILVKTLERMEFPSRDQAFFDAELDGPEPLIIQCFDADTLKSLAQKVPHIPRVQLVLGPTTVEDSISYHLRRIIRYGPELSLKEVANYAQGIGPPKNVFTSLRPERSRAMVDDAHAHGLAIHPWTFRREGNFVDQAFQGDSDHEMRYFYECLGVDGLFVEFPDQAAMVIERMMSQDSTIPPSLSSLPFAPRITTSKDELESQTNCMVNRKIRGCDIDMTLWNPSYIPRWLRGKSLTAMS